MTREEAENLKPGTLLRVAEHCRQSKTVKRTGEYGVLVLAKRKANLVGFDVVYPNGEKSIFVPANWEVV